MASLQEIKKGLLALGKRNRIRHVCLLLPGRDLTQEEARYGNQ